MQALNNRNFERSPNSREKLRKEKEFCGQAIVFVVVLFLSHSNLVV